MTGVTVEVREGNPKRYYGSSPPSNPSSGDEWFDNVNNVWYVYDGSSWKRKDWDSSDHQSVEHVANMLSKGIQPYSSDIQFSPTSGSEHDSVSWSSGTIRFADGSTQSINSGSTGSLSAGIYYIYFTVGSSTLTVTSTYSDVVGDDRGLLAIIGVSSDTSQEVYIQPFYSKGLNINADLIAANAIIAEHIKAGSITTAKLDLDRVTGSDPPGDGGELWWRTDLNQLRFRVDSSTVEYIPKFPIDSLDHIQDGLFTADSAGRSKFASQFINEALLANKAVSLSKLASGVTGQPSEELSTVVETVKLH